MKTALTNISIVPDLGSTPARVNRRTGELYLNGRTWNDLPPEHRLFILLHEAGHATLNTRNEQEADRFAFDAYAKLGYPLSESVKALTRVLHFENPGHYDRVAEQIRRAFRYDFFINGNKNINLKKMENVLNSAYGASFDGEYSNFTPKFMKKLLPKKARKKLEDKMQAKFEMQLSKAAASADPATRQAAAAAGAPAPGKAATDPGQVNAGPPIVSGPSAASPTPTGGNLKKYLIYGGAALAVILVLFFVLKKKR